MRSLIVMALLASLMYVSSSGYAASNKDAPPQNTSWRPLTVAMEPIQIRGDKMPGVPMEIGKATFLSGYELTSGHKKFGGYSSLIMKADGAFLAASDRGYWLKAHLELDGNGTPLGFSDAHIMPLLDSSQNRMTGLKGDLESVTQSGEYLDVGFERNDRIWRYELGDDGRWVFKTRLHDLNDEPMNNNGGLEALARLADGRLLAISETVEDDASLAWILYDDGTRAPFRYHNADGLNVTDMSLMPNGKLLVLERGWSMLRGLRIRLVVVDPADITPGSAVSGEEIIRMGNLYAIDNMEAVSTFARNDGVTQIYLLSDDNYNENQRTLLLVFELPTTS